MRILIRVVIGLVLLVLVAVAAGAAYQWAASSHDAATFPMPGERVDVGGRSLHLYCSGEGDTTVLLENGLTANYTAWLLVQQELAGFTKVCSYDRAGMGWSDESPNATRAQFVAADLQQLRTVANIDGPVVLAGWSAGGVFMREYYHAHPDGVVGMVLVDSSHEQQRNRLPTHPDAEKMQRALTAQLEQCRALAWSGIVRVMGVFDTLADVQKVPDAIRPASVAMSNRTGYCGGVQHEIEGFEADVSRTTPPTTLGDLPLVVLTRGRPSSPKDFPVPVPEEYLKEQDRVWFELQGELAALSTRASHRFVEGSGHGIPLEAPAAVVQAVRDVIDGNIPDGGA